MIGAVDMSINDKEIKELAQLARLQAPAETRTELTASVSAILDMVARVNGVDTDRIEPMCHPADAVQRLREDAVTEGDHKAELLRLSAHADGDYYLVPKVIE